MIVTVLGCGTSTGVPLIHCKCRVCHSKDPKNKRLRCSLWIQTRGKSILIDTSTDLRQQALRARISKIDAVCYTHPHADHIHGIDELRSYNYIQNNPIPVYGNLWTKNDLFAKFSYVFQPLRPNEGWKLPQLDFHLIDTHVECIDVQGVSVIPISLQHGSRESIGYRIDSVAYVTDCSYIPDTSLDRLKGLSVLFLDCVRIEPHDTHLNLSRSLEVISKVRPKKTFLTHLGHDFDFRRWTKKLPKGVSLAYDGQKLNLRYEEKGFHK